jgi:Ser/Thr protein kinase RdoA (MazF antagonist)
MMGELVGRGRTAEIYAHGEGRVLKLYTKESNPDWARSEFASTRIAFEAGVAVPEPIELIELDGRMGIIFERVHGKTMIGETMSRPLGIARLFSQMAELQVSCQAVKAEGLRSLKGSLERQVRRAERFGLSAAQIEEVVRRLSLLPDGDRLCHMDFHPDNVMITPKGMVIIDWMNATSGPPMADTARTWMMLTMGGLPQGFIMRALIQTLRKVACNSYLKRFRELHPFTQGELDAWMLPVAAARLVEDIPGEKDRLLRMVRGLLEKAPTS